MIVQTGSQLLHSQEYTETLRDVRYYDTDTILTEHFKRAIWEALEEIGENFGELLL